jgi:DNA-binding beta-propeller fold protein YncE
LDCKALVAILMSCAAWASPALGESRIAGLAPGELPAPRLPVAGSCPAIAQCVAPELIPIRPGWITPFPAGLAWDGTHLWVGMAFGSNTLYRIDPATCSISRTIQAPDANISGLAWDGTALWCLAEEQATIYRLDPVTGDILTQFPALSQDGGDLAWDNGYLWITDNRFRRIYKLDPRDGSVVASFPSPAVIPGGLEFHEGILMLTDASQDRILYIDPDGPNVLQSCASPDAHPWGLAMTPSGLWNGGIASREYLLGQAPTSGKRTTWGELKLHYR